MSRKERLEMFVLREIAGIIQTKLNDSRIGFVSVSGVELSDDFNYAKVYFSVLGTQKNIEDTGHGLKSASKFIKGELGKVLQIKTVPSLRFIYDDSLARGSDIVNKLSALTDNEIP